MKYLWYLLLVPGVATSISGIAGTLRAIAFKQSALRANGTVVENRYESDSDGAGTYHPEVEFETPDGRRHKFVIGTGSSTSTFTSGERVAVIYVGDNPDGKASIDTFFQLFFGPLMSFGMGLVFTAVAGIPLYMIRRRGNPKAPSQ